MLHKLLLCTVICKCREGSIQLWCLLIYFRTQWGNEIGFWTAWLDKAKWLSRPISCQKLFLIELSRERKKSWHVTTEVQTTISWESRMVWSNLCIHQLCKEEMAQRPEWAPMTSCTELAWAMVPQRREELAKPSVCSSGRDWWWGDSLAALWGAGRQEDTWTDSIFVPALWPQMVRTGAAAVLEMSVP